MLKKITKKIKEFSLKEELMITGFLLLLIFACHVPGMSFGLYSFLHILLVVVFIILALKLWIKKTTDEREKSHKALASEISFVIGGLGILFIILKDTFLMNKINDDLFIILFLMIFTRFVVRIWLEKNR